MLRLQPYIIADLYWLLYYTVDHNSLEQDNTLLSDHMHTASAQNSLTLSKLSSPESLLLDYY